MFHTKLAEYLRASKFSVAILLYMLVTMIKTICKAIGLPKKSVLGNLAFGQFWSGAGVVKGHDADDRIVYNTTTGVLYYDADGSGSSAAIQMAIIGASTHPTLTYQDLLIV